MTKKKKKRVVISAEEARQISLRKMVDAIFLNSGFEKIKTIGKEFSIGDRERNEIDSVFRLDNILIISEDTISTDHSHIRTKFETLQEIIKNKQDFLKILHDLFSFDYGQYAVSRWKIFYLYFCDAQIDFSSVNKDIYKPMRFVCRNELAYFQKMSNLLKKSFRFELFRFLDIKSSDIGDIGAEGTSNPSIPIVYPAHVSGITNDVSLVSFMVSADTLIKYGYVLRKDNWEESAGLYQRLIIPNKLKSIRSFIYENKRTFFNNIIVSLPSNVRLEDEDGNSIASNQLDRFKKCSLGLPNEFNSICIIDGQHRVYAYYEGDSKDPQETIISSLRKRIHLLVTGVIFPEDWSGYKKRAFESSLFLEINQNSKTVSKDITIHIESQKRPYYKYSIAREVLIKMNQNGVFSGRFQISLLETDKIKTSSIIQYALGRLVAANVDNNGLYKEWKKSLSASNIPDELTDDNDVDGSLLSQYISYCASSLNQYFSAIKNVYNAEWKFDDSKITKVFAINAFIISYHKSFNYIGVKDYGYYFGAFDRAERINFNNPGYAGSQYSKFADDCIVPILLNNTTETNKSDE